MSKAIVEKRYKINFKRLLIFFFSKRVEVIAHGQ